MFKDTIIKMINYWHDLVNYKKKKMKRYFVADCDKDGEAISDSIFEINYEQTVAEVREQIQEDIRAYLPHADDQMMDGLCQIVVDNFEDLKDN